MKFAYQVAGLRGKTLLDKYRGYYKAAVYKHAKKPINGKVTHDNRKNNKGCPPKLTERDCQKLLCKMNKREAIKTKMSSIYVTFFKNSVSNIERQVTRDLKDSNTVKTNITNPHYKTVIIPNVARITFYYKYRSHFFREEHQATEESSPPFVLTNIDRLINFFRVQLF